ncbi:MAG: protein-glutamate O-methyltransferase [Alphaproteobacteria bacterium]|nr:protein-glutamate O-methyltransferase [Alphaproteobacteria bacterium]
MKINDFDIYSTLLKKRSGLTLTPDKSYLLESRLTPIAKKWGLESLDALTLKLQSAPEEALLNDIMEAMTTNETSFFRDTRPFDLFRDDVLPIIQERRAVQKNLKIWCAAASSGQEPYSLAMILKELESTKFAGWRAQIKATDISKEIIDQAKKATYSQFEVQRGLPIQMLMKYFTQEEEKWRLKDDIRNMIEFGLFNLLESMAGLGTFDIIFCRNVLIYFDEATKADVLARMQKVLAPDGYLFLGGAETVLGITDAFAPVPDRRGLYAPKGSADLIRDTQKTAASAAAPIASAPISS